jgi:hypothetical protein
LFNISGKTTYLFVYQVRHEIINKLVASGRLIPSPEIQVSTGKDLLIPRGRAGLEASYLSPISLPISLFCDSFTQQFASRIDELEEMSTGNRIWKQRLVDIGTVTAQQAKDWGFSGVMLRGRVT